MQFLPWFCPALLALGHLCVHKLLRSSVPPVNAGKQELSRAVVGLRMRALLFQKEGLWCIHTMPPALSHSHTKLANQKTFKEARGNKALKVPYISYH